MTTRDADAVVNYWADWLAWTERLAALNCDDEWMPGDGSHPAADTIWAKQPTPPNHWAEAVFQYSETAYPIVAAIVDGYRQGVHPDAPT